MSLKRLLAVGQSFIGMSNEKSPFKMRAENLLPRFGRTAPQRPEPEAELPGLNLPPALARAAAPEPEQPPAPKGGARSTSPGAPNGEKIARSMAWFYLRNPWKRQKQEAGPLTQPELPLSKVRVVRNDLTDSDVEVVQKIRLAKPEPAKRPAVKAAKWSELTVKLFEAGRDQP